MSKHMEIYGCLVDCVNYGTKPGVSLMELFAQRCMHTHTHTQTHNDSQSQILGEWVYLR